MTAGVECSGTRGHIGVGHRPNVPVEGSSREHGRRDETPPRDRVGDLLGSKIEQHARPE